MQIKFRAWDKTNKKWLNNIYIANDGWIMDTNRDDGRDDVDIMIFTGLHDRNGKEIYEGDIVEGYRSHYIIVTWENYPFIGASVSKIIGNRYENPELIPLIL